MHRRSSSEPALAASPHRWEACRDRRCRWAAYRMTPATLADAGHLPGLRHDVVDDVVRTFRVAADAPGHIVEREIVARPPGDVVIGARGVAAHANAADERSAGVVES